MKYANGDLFIEGKQVSAFACAKTYKRMIELLENHEISAYYFNGWWSKCGNDKMKQVAQDKEGVWIEEERRSGKWKKLKGEKS